MFESKRQHAQCGCAGVSSRFTLGDVERQYERSRPFAVDHLALDLKLDFDTRSVQGSARLKVTRISASEPELTLDAVGFEIRSLKLGSGRAMRDADYTYDGDQIRIAIPPRTRTTELIIQYRAVPRRGLYFLAPDKDVPERPLQAWTQCQDEDARHWFPCHDKPHVKMTFEIQVTVPEGFVALSNGESIPTKSRRSFHFRMTEPLPSYLVTLVVGRFEVLTDRAAVLEDGRRVPCSYFVPPDRAEDGRRAFRETPRMIELFSRLTGVPYPWTRYTQVVVSDFIFGGMENTTATTMYEHILLDRRAALDVSSNDLVAHELAHQWFGDYVTCRDWSHAWLNEGFATYFEQIEREHRLGRDEYEYGIRADLQAYLGEANGRYTRPVVCRDYEQPIELFDRHLYEKGGLVLHMLRLCLGDDVFWAGVKLYLTRHARGIVETNDLQRALEEVAGRSLERFFDQWLYHAGHPVVRAKIGYDNGLLTVAVKQTQKIGETPVFAFDLEIVVQGLRGAASEHKKHVTTAQDALVIALPERPAYVAFDPRQQICGAITLEAPADMLREQLRRGKTARMRWSAAEALARRDDPLTIHALGKTLARQNEAWMVRAEAATALGRIRGKESFAALLPVLRAKHPKVRRAVAAALGEFKTAESAEALLGIAEKDQSYLVMAEAARATGRTRHKPASRQLIALLETKSWGDVTRAGALDGLAELKDETALPAVLDQTRYGRPTRARRAAILALARLADDKKTREQLELLLDDADPHLRIDVVRALELFGDTRCRGALRRQLERESDGRVARRLREALRDMSDGFGADKKRFATEIEGLQHELSDLRTRLSKLETQGRKAAAKPRSAPVRRTKRAR